MKYIRHKKCPKIRTSSIDMIILPPAPNFFAKTLNSHNLGTNRNFWTFLCLIYFIFDPLSTLFHNLGRRGSYFYENPVDHQK